MFSCIKCLQLKDFLLANAARSHEMMIALPQVYLEPSLCHSAHQQNVLAWYNSKSQSSSFRPALVTNFFVQPRGQHVMVVLPPPLQAVSIGPPCGGLNPPLQALYLAVMSGSPASFCIHPTDTASDSQRMLLLFQAIPSPSQRLPGTLYRYVCGVWVWVVEQARHCQLYCCYQIETETADLAHAADVSWPLCLPCRSLAWASSCIVHAKSLGKDNGSAAFIRSTSAAGTKAYSGMRVSSSLASCPLLHPCAEQRLRHVLLRRTFCRTDNINYLARSFP